MLRVLLVSLLIMASFTQAARCAPDDDQAVRAATKQFYTALNALFTGQVDPMKNVWSHADDVTYMGPGGGLQSGWEKVLAEWQRQADMKLGGKVEPSDLHYIVTPNMAIVTGYENGENVDKAGQPLKVRIRATNVFRKENGEWKMVNHHTDLLPYLEK